MSIHLDDILIYIRLFTNKWVRSHAYHLPINAWFLGHYALIVLLWKHSSWAIARDQTMYFQKQQYERIVPEKSGINRFSASHDIDLFYPIAMRHQFTVAALWLTSQLAEGHNSVKQKVIVPGTGHYRFLVLTLLTNGFSIIYHVMH